MLLSPLIIALGLAAAEPPTDLASPPLIAHPTYERVPTDVQFTTYYPKAAMRQGVTGKVVMECTVAPLGELRSCSILSETPTGYQFGENALKLKAFFRVQRPEGPCPRDVCAIVRIPIKYNLAP